MKDDKGSINDEEEGNNRERCYRDCYFNGLMKVMV